MKQSVLFRQGDVLLRRVARLPHAATLVDIKTPAVVLAYGEVTGHAHTLPKAAVKEYHVPAELGDVDRYLMVDVLSQLVHQEHATIDVPAGIYQVIQQREYTPERIRNVAD